MRKKTFLLACVLSASLLSGCNDTAATQEDAMAAVDVTTVELRQNDYRGGVIRTLTIKDKVLDIMNGMKRNNTIIRQDSPNSYWTTSGFQDFVATFLTAPIINDTALFNEEETDWDTIISTISQQANSFTITNGDGAYQLNNNVAFFRNEKDDYTITGIAGSLGNDIAYNGNIEYRLLYDCDKDWCKAQAALEISNSSFPPIAQQIFEYARINNDTFAIQTSNERLLVVLDPVPVDTDLRQRTIKEFYYSRLTGGQKTKFVPYEPVDELDENGRAIQENRSKNAFMAKYPLLNEEGDIATQYSANDSVFFQPNIYETNHSWVFEDGALQQAIVYKQGTLVVTTFNKLTGKYERFIYSTDAINQQLISEIEAMVNIEGLVGYVDVTVPETSSPTGDAQIGSDENTSSPTSDNTASNSGENSANNSSQEGTSDASSDTSSSTEANNSSGGSESGGDA